ncbi:hypothetical protein FC756_16250 [Lysinibacillus mangiferihumi]|uniref:Uncharacterized protein n=1 Tax=Lysinibacillus mangiferihumi TaxID=1130819 RepID=A0A4U2YWI7_9BACI|nr:hypothetical protein [Lysinibacillus mangiferihumi]TKI65600.1 hypothetical protein FC756_16250 [Lysinibacillus mangiferihumi]
MNIDEQIERELSCIDDLTAEIRILAHKLETDIAKQRKQDLHNSLEQLEKLRRRKELRSIAVELNLQGKKAKVVKKLAHQA